MNSTLFLLTSDQTLPTSLKPRIRIRSDGFMFVVNDPLHEDLYFEFEICIHFCYRHNLNIGKYKHCIFVA